MHPNLLALGAILLWSSLATLGVSLAQLPPFLLTGLALLIGSLPAWPLWRQWRVPPRTLALGVGGLFGYHFLLFIGLRLAPPVEANLVNYLWPLLIVLLAPVLLPGIRLRPAHVLAGLLGFSGAALAILGGSDPTVADADTGTLAWAGYLAAAAAAFTWAVYSLLTRRVAAFPTGVVGLFALLSGLLSLLCHLLLEPSTTLDATDLGLVTLIGLGPMGAAFYLWDRALKTGDARTIGLLSYLTPLGSTSLLLASTGRAFSTTLALATVMIVGSALLGLRTGRGDASPRTTAK